MSFDKTKTFYVSGFVSPCRFGKCSLTKLSTSANLSNLARVVFVMFPIGFWISLMKMHF